MEVPEHIYYRGAAKPDRMSVARRAERNSYAEDMYVPDKITVGAGGVLIAHSGQPNDVIRDKAVPPPTLDQISPIPSKLTANEFPSGDTKKPSVDHTVATKADSQESLLRNADSLNGLNTSLAVDADPIRELKNVRRQMGRLATRVLELEDENNRRLNREWGLWTGLVATGIAFLALLFGRR